MKLLALDTSTLTASVALVHGDTVRAHERSDVSTHSDNLLVLVDTVLKAAGLGRVAEVDAVAVGLGPGSFTGLRIGMATAKGLAYAADKPLYGASSLAAIAADVFAEHNDPQALYVPVLDARRSEVFAGFYRYDDGGLRSLADDCVLAPTELAARVATIAAGRDVIVGGDAIERYAADIGAAGTVIGPVRTPLATRVASICQTASARVNILVSGAPVYIRPSEAEIKFPKGNPGGVFTKLDE